MWLRTDEAPGEDRDVVLLDTAPPTAPTRSTHGLPPGEHVDLLARLNDSDVQLTAGLEPLASAVSSSGAPLQTRSALAAAHNDRGTIAVTLPPAAVDHLPLAAYSFTVPVACASGGRCTGRARAQADANDPPRAPASPPAAVDALLRSRHPVAWRLQSSADGGAPESCRWYDVDTRSRVVFPSASCAACAGTPDDTTLPPGVAGSTLTWTLPRPSHCTQYRLVLRGMGGGSVGGGGRLAAAATTGDGSPLLADPAAAGVLLSRLRLWGRRPSTTDVAAASATDASWGWRLLLVGPAGHRRLRLVCSSRALDAFAAAELPQQAWVHVSVAMDVEGDAGGAPVLRARLRVDDGPVLLLPAASVLSRGLHEAATAAASTAEGADDDIALRVPIASSLAAALGARSQAASNAVGGPCFLSAAAYGNAAAYGDPSVAEDAPPYPGSALACLRGAVAQLTVSDVPGAALLHPPPEPAGSLPSPPPLRARPLPSLEHALLLQLVGGSSAASFPTGEQRLRTDAPFIHRYREVAPAAALPHGFLRGTGVDAGASAAAPRGTAELGLGRVARHGGPVSVVCHDCGPAVYADDDAVGGPRFAAPADVEAARAVALQRAAAATAAGCVADKAGGALPPVPPSEAAPPAAPSSPTGGPRPPIVRVREEPLPPAVAAIVDAARAAFAATGDPSTYPPLPADSLLARALAPSPAPILVGHTYRLLHWGRTDVFVYFSHDRLAVPPPGWVAAGRAHGVPVLGTLIAEWDHGEAANEMLTRGALAAETAGVICPLAAALAHLAADRGFHGWLVNIEAPLPTPAPLSTPSSAPTASGGAPPAVAAGMAAFLRQLSAATHAAVPDGLVLWYDSLSYATGRVAWQSALVPAHNGPFLDACDGLFTDYHWVDARLRATHEAASALAPASRARDVAVGIDVWGRGMSTGGQWRTREAVEMVRAACKPLTPPQPQQRTSDPATDPPAASSDVVAQPSLPLSLALFAPAWAYEACGGADGDVALASALEARLWSGAGNCDEGEGGPAVVNPSGAVSDDAAVSLAGWTVTEGGADGWAVVKPDTGGPSCFVTSHRWCEARQTVPLLPAGSPVQALPPPSVIVSEWHAGSGPNTADSYRLRAWLVDAAGAPLAPHAAGSREPSWAAPSPWALDSGLLTTAREWRRVAHTFTALPPSAAAVVLSHGGCDAEHWAGQFGARMRGAAVTVPRSPAQADAAGLGCGLRLPPRRLLSTPPGVAPSSTPLTYLPLPRKELAALVSYAPTYGVRPAAATLPLATVFCDGIGGGWYEQGLRAGDAPWVDAGQTTPLPSFTDHHVGAGLAHLGGRCDVVQGMAGNAPLLTPLLPGETGAAPPPPARVSAHLSHHAAWERGGCLLVAASVPLLPRPQQAAPARFSGWTPLRLFALDVPLQQLLAPGADVAVVTASLTYRFEAVAGAPAASVAPVPLLLLDCGGLAAGERVAATPPAVDGGWVTATFAFRLPAALAAAGVAAAELWLAVCCGSDVDSDEGAPRTADVVLALGEVRLE